MSDKENKKILTQEEIDEIFGPIVIVPAVNKSRIQILNECCQKLAKCDWEEFTYMHTGEAMTQMVYFAMAKYTSNERRLSRQKNQEKRDLAIFHLKQYRDHCSTTVGDGEETDKETLEELEKALKWVENQ